MTSEDVYTIPIKEVDDVYKDVSEPQKQSSTIRQLLGWGALVSGLVLYILGLVYTGTNNSAHYSVSFIIGLLVLLQNAFVITIASHGVHSAVYMLLRLVEVITGTRLTHKRRRKRLNGYYRLVTDILNRPIIIDDKKVSRLYKHLDVTQSSNETLVFTLNKHSFEMWKSYKATDYENEAISYNVDKMPHLEFNTFVSIYNLLQEEAKQKEATQIMKDKQEAYAKFSVYEDDEGTSDIEQSLNDYSDEISQEQIENEKRLKQALINNGYLVDKAK